MHDKAMTPPGSLDARAQTRTAIELNLALAALISGAGTTTRRLHRPGSVRSEAAIRRLVAKATASTGAGVLSAAPAELTALLPDRKARLAVAHLDLVCAIARLRGWDLGLPSTQTLVRLALARTSPTDVADLLGVDRHTDTHTDGHTDKRSDESVHLTPTSMTTSSRAQLWSANRYAAFVLLQTYGARPEPTTLHVALAALELFGPTD